ncbi:MAG: 50S ribosomal protein L23 [Xanthomonadaceae bacterium]|nr:50S ribosomal protein L23 [Xanthomonadaceae bacterium]
MNRIYQIIKRPIISEKSTALAEVAGRYVFEVAVDSNKNEIKDAVETVFGVKVKNVHTMVMHGKMKRIGGFLKKKSNWKKALVTLGAGQKIEFFNTK